MTDQLEGGLRFDAAELDRLVDVLTGFADEDPTLPHTFLPGGTFDPRLRDEGLDWPATALTMIGRKRMQNFRALIEQAVADDVPGDIVEAGVWRGGASILARAVLAALGVRDRRVVVADSFQGLPPPRHPADVGWDFHEVDVLAVSADEVRANFARFGLLDDQVVFLEGWFRDTMPSAPVEQVAVLRLDGDMYESTTDVLTALWDRVPPGGWVIVDDYLHGPCRQAVHDFLDARGIEVDIRQIDLVGAYFQRPR